MKQFIFHQYPDERGMITLTGGDWRYLSRVRRLRPGDGFTALLPDGRKVHIEVREADGRSLLVQCVPPPDSNANANISAKAAAALPAAAPVLYLFQAMPKGAKLDLIVRQAAEACVTAIIPFYAARSQGRAAEAGGFRALRLQKIIREARQQSGSAVDTVVESPLDFDGMLRHRQEIAANTAGDSAAIFLHELPLLQTSFHEALAGNPAACAIAVGPEGGFTEDEARRFIDAGFTPIIVGNSILRTETAALYALAAVRTVLLERQIWNLAKK
jgi:16S rRNA (uracil1498-N3)-methyltransferase